MNNDIEWKVIYYHQEKNMDDSVSLTEWTEEAKYRNGYLVKHTLKEGNVITRKCITFCNEN